MNTCSQLTVWQKEDKGRASHWQREENVPSHHREVVMDCKQQHNVIVSWHAFIFFFFFFLFRPCLGYKCTLSCGTIVLLYASGLSGTTSTSELWPDKGLYVCIACFCFLKCAQLFAKCRQVQPFTAQKQTQKQEINQGSNEVQVCEIMYNLRQTKRAWFKSAVHGVHKSEIKN